jgi:hypothetical protein
MMVSLVVQVCNSNSVVKSVYHTFAGPGALQNLNFRIIATVTVHHPFITNNIESGHGNNACHSLREQPEQDRTLTTAT